MDIGSPDKNRPQDDYLTVGEVAKHYRTTDRTVQRWIREGRLKAVRLPGGRSYRISRSDLAAAIEQSA